MPDKELPEPGEFTRAFKLQYSGIHSARDADKKPTEVSGASGIFPEAAPSPDLNPAPPALPVQPSQAEPGEFTQFFKGGLPGKSTPAGVGAGQRSTYGVQRPNTPITPRNPIGDNGYNFNTPSARLDPPAHKPLADQYGMNNPRMGGVPDLSKQPAAEEGRAFDFKSLPTPAKKEEPGEYTALFGKAPIPPAPRPSAIAPAPVAPITSDVPPVEEAPRGPSEFTMMAKGRPQAAEAGGAVAPEAAAPAAAGADAKKLPVNVNVTPINPLAALPHVGGGMNVPGASAHAGLHGANVSTALGSASVQGPHVPQLKPLNLSAPGAAPAGMSANTKLILFFGVLAILAVILMVVVVATQKS